MATPLSLAIAAGQYTVTWNSVATGIYLGDAECPTIEQNRFGEAIANTDAYGKTKLDEIYQGFAARFMGTLAEYKAGSTSLLSAWASQLGEIGVIGTLATTKAAALVLTVVAGTAADPASGNPGTGPTSVTANYAMISSNFPVKILHGPTLRKIPMMMDLYPYAISGPKHVCFVLV